MKTLLVGLDGASWSTLEPLFDDGSMPNVYSIVTEGTDSPLESQIPPWTPSAWPSLYTGKNPGKHGVFDFLTYDGYEWGLTNATHVREPSIWEILDRYGYSSVVVNVPVTHPARPFDGALVPGYTAPEEPKCHPPDILETIREELGGYEVYPQDTVSGSEKTELRRRLAAIRARREAFDLLADRFDPDFGFVEFQQTDSIVHSRPGDIDALEAVYEAVDKQIGRLLETWNPNNVVLVSDHGAGAYEGYEFRINEFLRQNGYLRSGTEGLGRPRWKTTLNSVDESRQSDKLTSVPSKFLAWAARFMTRYGVTVQRIGPLLRKLRLNWVVGKILPEEVIETSEESVDFPNSVAYMRTRSECGLRLNLEGREPNGTVAQDEYESVQAELVSLLSSATAPNGKPIFEHVAPREEYFEGPRIERGPDIVTVPADFENLLSVNVVDDIFAKLTREWNHKRHGVFVAWGDTIDANANLGEPHLFDVCPTILATFDVPRDEAMDGDVLDVVTPAGKTTYPSYEPDAETVTTDGSVEDRLRDIGYLE